MYVECRCFREVASKEEWMCKSHIVLFTQDIERAERMPALEVPILRQIFYVVYLLSGGARRVGDYNPRRQGVAAAVA